MKFALGIRDMLRQAIYFARNADPGHRAPRRFYLAPVVYCELVDELTPSEFASFVSRGPEQREFCGVRVIVSNGSPRMVTAANQIEEL